MPGDRNLRSDDRHNHHSYADLTKELSGPARTLSKEEIETMDPKKPTPVKRIAVDALPKKLDTIDESLAKVQEALQSTLNALHRTATKELQLLDEKQLQSLNTIDAILTRHKKMTEDAPFDPTKLTDEQIEAKLRNG